MKIALVRPKVGFGLGGAENYAAHCAVELRRAGHEVTIVADYCDLPGVEFGEPPCSVGEAWSRTFPSSWPEVMRALTSSASPTTDPVE